MKKINQVTVLGANGTMGCNVSAIFAAFGNAKVYMAARHLSDSQVAVARAAKSVRAESIIKNLIPVDYTSLPKCVKDSDLVFESVKEDLETKILISKEVAKYLRGDAILCTGSSGLHLGSIADALPENVRPRYMGIHMFNPPYNLTLCELIKTTYTSEGVANEISEYLKKQLIRALVCVKDSPGFLGNRIGFQFMNKALQYAEKYKEKGGIDYIDAILGSFTGRLMPPLVTVDFVGLDVHKSIVDNLLANTKDYNNASFVLPKFVEDLIRNKKLGKKTGEGLYKTVKSDNGQKSHYVWDIQTGDFRPVKKYDLEVARIMKSFIRVGDYENAVKYLIQSQSEESKLCLEMILDYVTYSLAVSDEVSDGAHAADIAMATGFNWCPPLCWVDVISRVTNFYKLCQDRLGSDICKAANLQANLENSGSSQFNYRKYLRAI